MKGEKYRIITPTFNQEKKHCSQMDLTEKVYLLDRLYHIRKSKKLRPSSHMLRKTNVQTNKLQIQELLSNCSTKNIIEYNELDRGVEHDERIVIRSSKAYEVEMVDRRNNKVAICMCNLCLVISLISGTFVTAYYNESNDNHKTVDMQRYNPNLIIKKSH